MPHALSRSPEAILFTILPILIFESSFSANLFLFFKQLRPVLVMAIPVVLLTALVIAGISTTVFPYGASTYWLEAHSVGSLRGTSPVSDRTLTPSICVATGWDFPTGMLLGSILSPTDTVATLEIMKDLGVPESLAVILEGTATEIYERPACVVNPSDHGNELSGIQGFLPLSALLLLLSITRLPA